MRVNPGGSTRILYLLIISRFTRFACAHHLKVSKNWTLFIEKSIFFIFSCDGDCMGR